MDLVYKLPKNKQVTIASPQGTTPFDLQTYPTRLVKTEPGVDFYPLRPFTFLCFLTLFLFDYVEVVPIQIFAPRRTEMAQEAVGNTNIEEDTLANCQFKRPPRP